MDVFLDTNIFYNKYFLNESSFKFLSNYLTNTSSRLIISSLVCEEVENIRKRELNELRLLLKSTNKKIAKLTNLIVDNSEEKQVLDYSFKSILEKSFESVIYVDYDVVSQSEVVKRALSKKKPFREEEKGYRDTLIWLSLLKYLETNKLATDFAFISENKRDFYKDRDFHLDLMEDIKGHQLSCTIKPYLSLYQFISSNIDKEEHKIKHKDLYDDYLVHLDSEIEFGTSSFINDLSKEDFLSVLNKSRKHFPTINYLTDFYFDVVEGVEDATVVKYEKYDKNQFYILYNFNLRISELRITIRKGEYLIDQSKFDNSFVNIEQTESEVILYAYTRAYFETSFNFNLESEAIEGFEVISSDFR